MLFKPSKFAANVLRFAAPALLAGMMGAPSAWTNEMVLRLSRDVDYPGYMLVTAGEVTIKHLCFLGAGAKGQVDRGFLKRLAQSGIPEGEYGVAAPLAEEKWPVPGFSDNGALRLRAVDPSILSVLQASALQGLAIHGRDFYPLVVPRVKTKSMVGFYNDSLFDGLRRHWGALRISNWDMGRLWDFWERVTPSPEVWKAKVVTADTEEARRQCKPPVVKRKLE